MHYNINNKFMTHLRHIKAYKRKYFKELRLLINCHLCVIVNRAQRASNLNYCILIEKHKYHCNNYNC